MRFSVLINGTSLGFYTRQSRGLSQENPLSHYLFVIRLEAFSSLIKRAMSGVFLLGCRVKGKSGEGVQISHLLFTNDMLVFCKASQDQMALLKLVANVV